MIKDIDMFMTGTHSKRNDPMGTLDPVFQNDELMINPMYH